MPVEPPGRKATQIQHGLVWQSLLIPPLATGISALLLTNSAFIIPPILGLLMICIYGVVFCKTIGARYRGAAKAGLVIAYIIGQLAICFGAWFGGCIAVLDLNF